MPAKTAIIIGAGPAGLTAAYELLTRTDIIPIILEKSGDIGGISKTVNYKGNRIDIGGHRFFSKSDRVMQWWMNIMPIQPTVDKEFTVTYRRHSRTIKAEEPLPKYNDNESSDLVMLVRRRLSRIYFLRKFFTYPIQLSLDTLKKLGLARTMGILVSYIKSRLFPRMPEKSLEDFFINRFGDKLYRLFFKDYTEKVWGVPCTKISAEWGAQRIKGISIGKAIAHALKSMKPKKASGENNDISQKGTETSLIEKFLYPKFGPGQLWEEVARQVVEKGGRILMQQEVKALFSEDHAITAIETIDTTTGDSTLLEGDYFFSTMPVQELIAGMGSSVPTNVQQVAAGLQYRDFITVGVLLRRITAPGQKAGADGPHILPDTWIYIQEKDVKVGRLQIFNNWSPFMVKDPDTVWIGMEYFCNKGDGFWNLSDDDIQSTAISELEKMGLIAMDDVLDGTVLRMEKTYPAYFGTYNHFEEVRAFTDSFVNLFLVGRNGMHKYNNSDHSMLTAMVAVDNIASGITSKANIWSINTEQEYHEEKAITQMPTETSFQEKPTKFEESFWEFLWSHRMNRRWLYIVGIAILIQFIIFKYLYPFASFIYDDSFVYLKSAWLNLDVDTYPIGYPRFLRLFSVFTNSDTVLTAFQYLCVQASSLLLLFTIDYFYRPSRAFRNILLCFSIFNPLYLYIANLVATDALFLALSLTWFTLLLWIVQRPSRSIMFWHALVLFAAFSIRYNAMIYPIIAVVAFWLSPWPIAKKIIGYSFSLLLVGLFILNMGSQFKRLTGTWQFSPFSGWQLANNAMYAYRYVSSADRKPVPARFNKLDQMIRAYFDARRDIKQFPVEDIKASTVYMWTKGLPLMRYMDLQFKNDSTATVLKKWASMGPIFQEYGSYIICHYPKEFALYYMWPNFLHYYAPPVEFLEQYNMGKDSVREIAQSWFRYKSTKVYARIKDETFNILDIFPVFAGIINIVMLCSLLCFIVLQGFHKKTQVRNAILVGAIFWIINAVFTIFASPAALRFQSFPLIVVTTFSALLLDWMFRLMLAKTREECKNYQDINLTVARF